MVIPREAKKITYSTNIRILKKKPLSVYQRAVAVGSILGDACVSGNWSKTNYRLQIRQCSDQEAYVQWKYEVFKDFVLTPPQHYDRTQSVWFRTISHPDITRLHKAFYQEGKKVIPLDIEEWLENPITVAVWFMDDGNAVMRKRALVGYHLNTQSFSMEENVLLANILERLHDIHCTVERNHEYWRLAIWQKDSRARFVRLIRPHILQSLKYKIG